MLTVINEENRLPDDFQHRKGWFLVSKGLLDMATADLLQFMGNFLIIRAEFMCDVDAMEYTAISRLFDPIEPGHKLPQYIFNITKKSDGHLKISVMRINPDENGTKGAGLVRLLRKLDG